MILVSSYRFVQIYNHIHMLYRHNRPTYVLLEFQGDKDVSKKGFKDNKSFIKS